MQEERHLLVKKMCKIGGSLGCQMSTTVKNLFERMEHLWCHANCTVKEIVGSKMQIDLRSCSET